MTYFQPYVTQLGAQGAGRSAGPGFPPLTSQGYIANPGDQQYMQMQSTPFYPQQNLRGTYESPQQPPRIELNPNAVAYQSYTSPSPPGPSSQQYPRGGNQYQRGDQIFQGGDLRYQGGDQRFQGTYQMEAGQMYQDRSKQYQVTPLFRPYQNGPEILRVAAQKPCPQRPMTPHTLKSPLQTFSVPAPSLGESTIQTPKPENTDGLTLSYPDDQSMFVKDSGQGMPVPSTAAEDVFKAKASLYGIEICTKAERLATAEKQNKTVNHQLYSLHKDSTEVNGEKKPEMLFQMTHIEPEESNESEEDAATSSITEVTSECTTVHQQFIPDYDQGKNLNSSEDISNPFFISPEEYNGCVLYSEGTEQETEEKSKLIEIPRNSWSSGSCANSIDECDSFNTAHNQDGSDGEIGIFRNYVLEALMSKSPQTKKKDDAMQNSEFPVIETEQCETMTKKIADTDLEEINHRNTEEFDHGNGDTFDSLVEEYVKSIIRKACEAVTKQCNLPGECRPAVNEMDEENINNCSCKETDYEKPNCVKENHRKLKCQDEADDTRVSHEDQVSNTTIKHQIDADDSKDGPVEQVSELSLASSSSSAWAMAWNVKHSSCLDENSNYCNSNVEKVKAYHQDSESTEQSSDYSDSGSGSQLNPITPEFRPRKHLKNKTVSSMRPDAPVFQPLNVQTLPRSVKQKVTIMREVTVSD
ncbi:uncharacterized protein LOC117336224 [Pecten maximus]|uniref:uncharacterized protein LOC117336224 n=1 Tax=Pecten maximus TaxID=6579 RepID=UPI00145840EE|nr:uncharacterized protein LOC117336224 [Pecten maximus]